MSASVRPVVPAMRAIFMGGTALVFVAGASLFVLSSRTDRFFAWTIGVPLTAAFLGAFYWVAVALAALSARERVWARARIGIPGVTAFVVLTLVATLLHLDQFHLGDPDPVARAAAWVWLGVYAVEPLALAGALTLQLRAAGADPPRDAPLPRWLRVLGVAQAAVLLGYGVALFAVPETASRWWPWPLTPLTARSAAAWLVGVGIIVAQGAWENDWGRIRLAGVPYVLLAALQGVALLRFSDQVPWDEVGPWLYVAFLGTLAFVGAVVFARGRQR